MPSMQTRKFDGKKFKFTRRFRKRSDADKRAVNLRKNHQYARVVPHKLNNQQWYAVYYRQRVRGQTLSRRRRK